MKVLFALLTVLFLSACSVPVPSTPSYPIGGPTTPDVDRSGNSPQGGSSGSQPLAAADNGQQQVGPSLNEFDATHFARLEELNPVFETYGWEAWLRAAGLTWDEIFVDARQIEQETNRSTGRISASGVQIRGINVWIPWPNVLTTDRANEVRTSADTFRYQPDARNPSVMYSNVWLDGQGTVWIDGQNWGQFVTILGFVTSTQVENPPVQPQPTSVLPTNTPLPSMPPTSVPTSTPVPVIPTATSLAGCFTISQLDERYGIERNAQLTVDGLLYDGDVLAGAVLRLNATEMSELEGLGWIIQGSNPDVKSAWSPESCRPLAE